MASRETSDAECIRGLSSERVSKSVMAETLEKCRSTHKNKADSLVGRVREPTETQICAGAGPVILGRGLEGLIIFRGTGHASCRLLATKAVSQTDSGAEKVAGCSSQLRSHSAPAAVPDARRRLRVEDRRGVGGLACRARRIRT